MRPRLLLLTLSCAVSACGQSSELTVPKSEDFGACHFMSGTSVRIEGVLPRTSVGCNWGDLAPAADGNPETFATLQSMGVQSGRCSVRVTSDKSLPAGQVAGVIANITRNGVTSSDRTPNATVRTYLAGELQEEAVALTEDSFPAANVSASTGQKLFQLRSTKPFDAVELALGDATQQVDADIFEFCSDIAGVPHAPPADPAQGALTVTAVVADVSAGTNPYHAVFRRPWTRHPSTVIPGFPKDAPALPLTLGEDWNENFEKDAALWSGMKKGVVYWVPGTDLLLLNNDRGESGLINGTAPAVTGSDSPLYDDEHGTGTSSTIAETCRDCYVLVVYDPLSGDGEPVKLIADTMPWVDFVQSTQIQDFTGEQLVDFSVPDAASGYAQATRRLAETGRMFFSATGNTPVTGIVNLTSPLPIFNWNSPPWVVAVAGAQSACSAIELMSGHPQDFVGDYSRDLAQPRTVHGKARGTGTSFASPQVAARAAQTLVAVRQLLGDHRAPGYLWAGPMPASPFLPEGRLTGQGVVDALALTAHYFAPDDYKPLDCNVGVIAPLPAPASPMPWVEMGWGYPSAQDALQAARVIAGVEPAPEKDPDAVAFMGALHQARAAAYGQ